MSEPPVSLDSDDPPETAVLPRYWSFGRLLVAGVLIVGIFGFAGYLVHDDVRTLIWGEPAHPGLAQFASAANRDDAFDWSGLTVDRDRILSGGPPKDGIPALTDPPHVAADDADFLPDDARVVGVTLGGESRAYPIRVLNWHEIINDTLGEAPGTLDIPIAVIYCPLCDSVSVVDRRLDGATLEFGVSGLLTNSNVILYDRTTDGLWSQVKLEAISGPHVGRTLTHLNTWNLGSWADWKRSHPDTTVVSFETGYGRDYGRSPYTSYFANDDLMFPAEPLDHRMPNKTPVIGIRVGDQTRAYPVVAIDGELRDTLGGETIVLRNEGDRGVTLEQVPEGAQVVHTFWFAWCAFHPETTVYGDGES